LVLIFLAAIPVGTGPVLGASYRLPTRTPGEEIFDNRTVLRLRLQISDADIEMLRRDDRKQVPGTLYEGSNTWRNIAVRIKGGPGSRRQIDDRASLTLSFNKTAPGQRFHGLRRIHLNSSVQDQTYLCESVCSELFRSAGVPAARVSFATLAINGVDKGLYVLKEGFTKDMLGMYFTNTKGNLYDSGFLRDIDEQLENDRGSRDVKDWSDLKALSKAAQEPDEEKRWAELNRILDVDRFISFAALEVMTWHWDGYLRNRNNYRVYHDLDTGRMVFFPHGMDQMFRYARGKIMPDQWFRTIVAEGLIPTTTQGEALYLKRFGEIYTNVFRLERLTNRVGELADLLRPHAGPEYDAHVKRMRDLIVARHTHLGRALHGPAVQPLIFTNGIAKLIDWENNAPEAARDVKCDTVEIEGRKTLHIFALTNGAASWQATVRLSPGRFRFEALAKARNVVRVANARHALGAGIRNESGGPPRISIVRSDSSWERLSYDFYVREDDEITLRCELSASEGEVWFDVESLRLVKVE
jgi:spore coat protein CotH